MYVIMERKMHSSKHMIVMAIGCVVPLLLVFMLPVIGVITDYTVFIFLIAMFVSHLLMMRGHGNKDGGDEHGHH